MKNEILSRVREKVDLSMDSGIFCVEFLDFWLCKNCEKLGKLRVYRTDYRTDFWEFWVKVGILKLMCEWNTSGLFAKTDMILKCKHTPLLKIP